MLKVTWGIGGSIHNKSGFRNSKSSNANPATTFKSYVEYFDFFIDRLRGIFLENLDYRECIKKYDTTETVFYVDPPYVHSTRSGCHNYAHEMTDDDHHILIEMLKNIKGQFLLSGYENDIYPAEWLIAKKTSSTQKSHRVECLYSRRK